MNIIRQASLIILAFQQTPNRKYLTLFYRHECNFKSAPGAW